MITIVVQAWPAVLTACMFCLSVCYRTAAETGQDLRPDISFAMMMRANLDETLDRPVHGRG